MAHTATWFVLSLSILMLVAVWFVGLDWLGWGVMFGGEFGGLAVVRFKLLLGLFLAVVCGLLGLLMLGVACLVGG